MGFLTFFPCMAKAGLGQAEEEESFVGFFKSLHGLRVFLRSLATLLTIHRKLSRVVFLNRGV